MSELEVAQIEKRLADVIDEKRRKAISYTLLTILCTPAFVLLGSLVSLLVLAWILCQLAIEKTMPLDAQSVPKRILNMLVRLKLVQVTDRKLRLTLKGQDFIGVTCGSR